MHSCRLHHAILFQKEKMVVNLGRILAESSKFRNRVKKKATIWGHLEILPGLYEKIHSEDYYHLTF